MFHRKPSFAGTFYPDNKSSLYSTIEKFINKAESDKTADVIGVVSPHAGYLYSGPIAAYSYKAVMGKNFDCVIVLAPSHRGRFDGYSVISKGIYETPMGGVVIDSVIGEKLSGKKHATFQRDVDLMEHSLEVQVPFLQYALNKFTLVPVIVGTTDLATCRIIAEEIFDCIKNDNRKILVVISSDLSHYYSYEMAIQMDSRFAEVLSMFDESALSELLAKEEAEACGEGPLIVGMSLLKKMNASSVKILKYANSGDTSGDKSRVVGYISASFVR